MKSPKLKGSLIKRLDKDEMNGIDRLHMQQEPWRLPSRHAEFSGTDRLSLMRIVIVRQ